MKARPCSVRGIIATTVLSSHKVLGVLKSVPFHRKLGAQELREAAYLTYHQWEARYPDHVFQSGWQLLDEGEAWTNQKNAPKLWALQTLVTLADEFLELKGATLTVPLNKFGSWQQSVLSRISGLPIQAAAAGRGNTSGSNRMSPILSPHDAEVEEYIKSAGLNETHLHLNGTTHAEICWLRALRNPRVETRDFEKKWKATSSPDSAKIRELAHAVNPDFSPAELYRQLRVAAQLRKWLVAVAADRIGSTSHFPFDYEDLATGRAPLAPEPWGLTLGFSAETSITEELAWITELIGRLIKQPNVRLDRMLHCYLILQNQYYRLLVQSEEQYGFDQFQKLTYTNLREPAEKDYFLRFSTMHGETSKCSRVRYLEGRFAPKSSLQDNCKLLKSILAGYLRYLDHDFNQGPPPAKYEAQMLPPLNILLSRLNAHLQHHQGVNVTHHRLALVAHFIKQPWRSEPAYKAGPYRFYRLRHDLEHRANVILHTLKRWPDLGIWLRGIDAAANELHAPPEVFASCFRVCKTKIPKRTYHAGEDFPHLLTGLRHMLDALELLELGDGDRIGHGTAMGISPQLWIDRMPGKLTVKTGEWMLDLLAVWRLLKGTGDCVKEKTHLESELSRLGNKIFGKAVECKDLASAMQFRGLNLHYLSASQDKTWNWKNASFSIPWRAEAERVHDARTNYPQDIELLWTWLSDKELWKRSEALMEVDTAYFDVGVFVRIQQMLMEEVGKRKVVIETLPSSNVRISQYYSFQEHHSLRWMKVGAFSKEGDPDIKISLGSDDPGIFAGDLNSEFYQLYAALRSAGLDDKKAVELVANVNEQGKQSRFHDSTLK